MKPAAKKFASFDKRVSFLRHMIAHLDLCRPISAVFSSWKLTRLSIETATAAPRSPMRPPLGQLHVPDKSVDIVQHFCDSVAHHFSVIDLFYYRVGLTWK